MTEVRALRTARVLLLGAVATLLVATAVPAASAPVGVAAQPPQPTRGPGSTGPCGQVASTFPNTAWPGEEVHVFLPVGRTAAPVAGRCDGARRPTVVLAHGTGEDDPRTFAGLVRHLVSRGSIVVYPTHTMERSDEPSNHDAYRAVRDGMLAAAGRHRRIDTARVGFWGHSFGGGMVPYLVQQASGRGWGRGALWLSIVAQADTLLVTRPGTRAISVPRWAQSLTVSMEDDEAADNRLGIDVFESLTLPAARKRYVRLHTDAHGQPAIVSNHAAPAGDEGRSIDAIDHALWRYADLLADCALHRRHCDADLSPMGSWSDGTPLVPALVAQHPVDSGPYPAALAECDTGFGLLLNQDRIAYCGATHL